MYLRIDTQKNDVKCCLIDWMTLSILKSKFRIEYMYTAVALCLYNSLWKEWWNKYRYSGAQS